MIGGKILVNNWQNIVTLIVSMVGVLTTIYNMGFKKEHGREQEYYENILKPFVTAYHNNSNIDTVLYLKNYLKRKDDSIPKYIFYLYDNQKKDKLRNVLLYDYFDLYCNDDNIMRRIMGYIIKTVLYIMFGATLFCIFYGSFVIVSGVVSIIIDSLYGLEGTINGVVSWQWYLGSIALGLFNVGGSYIIIKLIKKTNDDRYTFDKNKIDKIIDRKEKSYIKHKEKYVF